MGMRKLLLILLLIGFVGSTSAQTPMHLLIPKKAGAGCTYDCDAETYFAAVLTAGYTMNSTEKDAVDDVVTSLKSGGYWSHMIWYPLIGAASAPCAIAARNPGTYSISWTGGTFNSTGVDPNGSSDFGDFNFNPSTDLSGSGMTIGFYSRENTASGNKIDMGVADGSNQIYVAAKYLGVGSAQIGRGYNSLISGSSPANTVGFFITTTDGTTTCDLYKDGSSTGTGSGGGSKPNSNLLLFKYTSGDFSDREAGMVFIYDGYMNSTDISNITTIFATYMSAMSR